MHAEHSLSPHQELSILVPALNKDLTLPQLIFLRNNLHFNVVPA